MVQPCQKRAKTRPAKTRLPAEKILQNLQQPQFTKQNMSDAGDISGNYNDGNRAFLQSLLARGTMNFEEGRKVLAAIFTIQEGQ